MGLLDPIGVAQGDRCDAHLGLAKYTPSAWRSQRRPHGEALSIQTLGKAGSTSAESPGSTATRGNDSLNRSAASPSNTNRRAGDDSRTEGALGDTLKGCDGNDTILGDVGSGHLDDGTGRDVTTRGAGGGHI